MVVALSSPLITRSKHAPGSARRRDLESALVRRLRRARRPLVALVALVLLLAIGYGVKACDGSHENDRGTSGVGAGADHRLAHTDGRALRLAPR
jgi:hypothetical protein